MDNLTHFYYFENHKEFGMCSRFTMKQVLYDLVTVPEKVRAGFEALRKTGCPGYYRPSFYILKYAPLVYERFPNIDFRDLCFLSNKLGRIFHEFRLMIPVSIEMEMNEKIPLKKIPENSKFKKFYEDTNEKTGNMFRILIHFMPDFQ